jgi:hypothetical protein
MFKILEIFRIVRKKRNEKRKGNEKPKENSKNRKLEKNKKKNHLRHVNGLAQRRAYADGAEFRPANRRSIGIATGLPCLCCCTYCGGAFNYAMAKSWMPGVAASKGRPRGWLSGERSCGGGGFSLCRAKACSLGPSIPVRSKKGTCNLPPPPYASCPVDPICH